MDTVRSQPEDDNSEAIDAWNGPLFDRFLRYRDIVTTGLGTHGDAGVELLSAAPGDRVLDIGCGFGDTTLQIAQLVGPHGMVVGVDAASRFIEIARSEQGQAANVRYDVSDVQLTPFDDQFDSAFSRFGTMFFASPVAALRNVRQALAPGGALVMVVWRRREDNPWLYDPQRIVESFVSRPEEYDQPTCGPGPFSMADADTVTDIVAHAGFTDIELHRRDRPIAIGRSLEQAIDIIMAIGPGAEILRLQGERAAHLHEPVREALRAGLAGFVNADGSVSAMASSWLVGARAPG